MNHCEPDKHQVRSNYLGLILCIRCWYEFSDKKRIYSMYGRRSFSEVRSSLKYEFGDQWELEYMKLKAVQHLLRLMFKSAEYNNDYSDQCFFTYESFAREPYGLYSKILSEYEKKILKESEDEE